MKKILEMNYLKLFEIVIFSFLFLVVYFILLITWNQKNTEKFKENNIYKLRIDLLKEVNDDIVIL